MITETKILRFIRSRLGASVRNLEMTDKDIMDCIEEEVLPEVSSYYPYQIYHDLHVRNDRTNNPSEYWLKLHENYSILTVNKVFLEYSDMDSSYPENKYSGSQDLSTVAYDQMNANLSSFTEIPITARFIPPNKVSIAPVLENMTSRNKVRLRLDVVHKSVQTMKPGLESVIKDVAMGVICENILGKRRFFTNLSTTFGELEVNTEMLLQFIEKKENAIQKMEENFVIDYPQKVWVF